MDKTVLEKLGLDIETFTLVHSLHKERELLKNKQFLRDSRRDMYMKIGVFLEKKESFGRDDNIRHYEKIGAMVYKKYVTCKLNQAFKGIIL